MNPNIRPPPTVVHNTLNNVPPQAGFAFGNRYEFGYQRPGYGWMIGVLDGPELNQTQFFGFCPECSHGGGFRRLSIADYTGRHDIGPGTGPIAGAGTRAFGFGSVPVLFETPPGYLLGFRDYMNNFSDALLGTQRGPIAYVGNYGESQDPNACRFRSCTCRRPQRQRHSWRDPGRHHWPDGVARLGFIHDFDDLHKFNIFFDYVTVHNRTTTSGVEAMWTHDLTNQHYMAKHQNNQLSVAWGARFLRMYDEFDVNALAASWAIASGILRSRTTSSARRWHSMGQRAPAVADSDRRPVHGRLQHCQLEPGWLDGRRLDTGRLNRPLYARPTAFSHGSARQEFAPVGELRVAASYHVTSAFALNLGYTGSVVGGIRRAAIGALLVAGNGLRGRRHADNF